MSLLPVIGTAVSVAGTVSSMSSQAKSAGAQAKAAQEQKAIAEREAKYLETMRQQQRKAIDFEHARAEVNTRMATAAQLFNTTLEEAAIKAQQLQLQSEYDRGLFYTKQAEMLAQANAANEAAQQYGEIQGALRQVQGGLREVTSAQDRVQAASASAGQATTESFAANQERTLLASQEAAQEAMRLQALQDQVGLNEALVRQAAASERTYRVFDLELQKGLNEASLGLAQLGVEQSRQNVRMASQLQELVNTQAYQADLFEIENAIRADQLQTASRVAASNAALETARASAPSPLSVLSTLASGGYQLWSVLNPPQGSTTLSPSNPLYRPPAFEVSTPRTHGGGGLGGTTPTGTNQYPVFTFGTPLPSSTNRVIDFGTPLPK